MKKQCDDNETANVELLDVRITNKRPRSNIKTEAIQCCMDDSPTDFERYGIFWLNIIIWHIFFRRAVNFT